MSASTWVRDAGRDESDPLYMKVARRARERDDAPEPIDHGPVRDDGATTYYDETLKIPGYGDAPGRCRPLTPVGFCMEGHPILGRSSCGARYCPDHWRDWCEGATVNSVARTAAKRAVGHPAASHVVVSPPPGRYSQRAVWDGRSDAYDVLKAAGMDGGALVAHPYVQTGDAEELWRTAQDAGDLPESTGIWRFLRETSDDWSDLSRHIEGRPHYHAVGPVGDINQADVPEGWVVKRIRNFQPFYYDDSDGYEDMAATVYYVLTHAGVQEGRQSVTYFGSVHPASFQPSEALTAAKWDRIKREAEKAVKGGQGAEEREDGPAHGPAECPRDGCEAETRPFYDLREMLNDPEWVAHIKSGVDGRQRWLVLRGMLGWWGDRVDRPPPGVTGSEQRLLDWLEDAGRRRTARPEQSRVGSFG